MRVAVVLPELDPHSGGGFTFQDALHRAVVDATPDNHEWIVYARSGAGDVQMPVGKPHLAAGRALRAARDFQDRLLGIRVAEGKTWFERSLREQRIDLVWFATPYATDTELPYIFTIWDLQYLEQPWFPELREQGEWERRDAHYTRYVPRAVRVIVPNEAGAEQLLRWFPIRRERVLCLPHPTPPFALDAAKAAGGDPPAEPPYLLYPAQFWAHKNHTTLLRSMARLPARYRLVCVGSDKGQAAHVDSLARRYRVEDRVEMRGFVSVEELVGLYRHAHALVYPSLFGPENMPPLEAFALECPVIQADVPGAREQLGDAAIRVPPMDDEAYADAVVRLEDDALRAQLAERGAAIAAERSASRYVAGVVEFLDEFERVRELWP